MDVGCGVGVALSALVQAPKLETLDLKIARTAMAVQLLMWQTILFSVAANYAVCV